MLGMHIKICLSVFPELSEVGVIHRFDSLFILRPNDALMCIVIKVRKQGIGCNSNCADDRNHSDSNQ